MWSVNFMRDKMAVHGRWRPMGCGRTVTHELTRFRR